MREKKEPHNISCPKFISNITGADLSQGVTGILVDSAPQASFCNGDDKEQTDVLD